MRLLRPELELLAQRERDLARITWNPRQGKQIVGQTNRQIPGCEVSQIGTAHAIADAEAQRGTAISEDHPRVILVGSRANLRFLAADRTEAHRNPAIHRGRGKRVVELITLNNAPTRF